MKNFIKIFYVIGGLLAVLYAAFLFVVPKVLTSPEYVLKYEKLLKGKTGFNFSIQDMNLRTKPTLGVEIFVKKIDVKTPDNKDVALVNNTKYGVNLLNIRRAKLQSEYVYADIDVAKKYFKSSQKESKPFNINLIPQLNIDSAYVKFDDKTYTKIDYIKSETKKGKIETSLLANVISEYAKSPITIGKEGKIVYSGKDLNFDNFSVRFGKSVFFLAGDAKKMLIKGNSLPVGELETAFLYFYKLKNPNKRNFIENFTNMKGTMDVDLVYSKGILDGNCKTHNLGADFSNLKIPVFLPETVFNFENKTIKAQTKGMFGTEPVRTDFLLTGLLTKDLTVKGNVYSTLTGRFTQNYFPQITVIGDADASVKYLTHNGKVDVDYRLKIPKGTNITSAYGGLDNTDKEKLIFMHTQKQGDPMKITEYYYSISENGVYNRLISGDGLFEKINGRYKLSKLSAKTDKKVSVDIIRSFLKNYVHGGTFDADINIDILTKTLLGSMNLYDIRHANFLHLQNTGAKFEKEKITVNMEGTFYDSPIVASAIAKNDVDNIVVNNIDVHLNSFYVQKGRLTSIPKTFQTGSHKKNSKPKDIDVTVEKGKVKVDKIYGRLFEITNVEMQGTYKNNIANFVIPQAVYAKGLLSAKGQYNVKNYSSDIHFLASDIDSNEIATNFFNLKNQVEGKGFATFHLITKDKLNDIKASVEFAISDGFLPTIGSQEFIISSSKKPSKSWIMNKFKDVKISLSKITNIDFSKPNVFYSNLYGGFNVDNEEVKDVKIFSKSDFLSLFIEGNYNIETESGDLSIWGRRNKTEAKKMRILKIPVNLLYRVVFRPERTKDLYQDKISQIPEIKTKIGDDVATFRVNVSGNINTKDKLKVILKDIR